MVRKQYEPLIGLLARSMTSDAVQIRPRLPWRAFGYNCDGPVNALFDLALGMDSPPSSAAVEVIDTTFRSAASGELERIER